MADDKPKALRAEEIDLTPEDDELLDKIWDALDEKWSNEKQPPANSNRDEENA